MKSKLKSTSLLSQRIKRNGNNVKLTDDVYEHVIEQIMIHMKLGRENAELYFVRKRTNLNGKSIQEMVQENRSEIASILFGLSSKND